MGTIDVISDLDPAPISLLRARDQRIGIVSEGLVEVAREVNGGRWRTENLNGGSASIGRAIHATNENSASAEFENGTRVDHQSNTAWDIEGCAVTKCSDRRTAKANFVSGIVGQGGSTRVTDESDDVSRGRNHGRFGDTVEWSRQRTIPSDTGKCLVNDDSPRASRRCPCGADWRSCAEPEVEIAAGDTIAVTIECATLRIGAGLLLDDTAGRGALEIDAKIVSALAGCTATGVTSQRIVVLVASPCH